MTSPPTSCLPPNLRSDGDRLTEVDVLVVGAGPTGLTAAAEALRHGLSVRILQRKPTRNDFSKALVVHARTMEAFGLMGIAQEVRELGAPFAALNLHFNNRRRPVRVDLLDQPWGDTEYPYWLSVPQYDTERVLESHLRGLGGEVEWSRPLRTLQDRGDFVDATVENGADVETIRARWVIGCDGGQSTVRGQAGITLKRTGAGATFLLADVKTTSGLVEDEGHLYLGPEGLLILVPMPAPGRWRVIAHVAATRAKDTTKETAIDAAYLDRLIHDRTGMSFGAHDATWTSQFNLSHGVAERFSSGRIFVAGDAAHIHSPVGGQGLNTGVLDAHNLVWRLAESLRATPADAEKLIRRYESERRVTAAAMVRGVARMTSIMTSPRSGPRHLRKHISPLVVSRPFVQAKLGRGIGMLNLSYSPRSSLRRPLRWSVGHRLPNPVLDAGGRLYDQVSGTGYCWVVRDDGKRDHAVPGPDSPCWRGLPVVKLTEADPARSTRTRKNSRVVLVRPDRCIAAVGPDLESLCHALPQPGGARPQTPQPQVAGADGTANGADRNAVAGAR